MEPRFEETHQKYREAVNDMNSAGLSALKAEIEALMENQRSRDENHTLLDEEEDMLIDVKSINEETHCQPLKCSCK